MWTKEEIAARSGVPMLSVSSILRSLANSREAKTLHLSGDGPESVGWYLTDAGIGAAKGYLDEVAQ